MVRPVREGHLRRRLPEDPEAAVLLREDREARALLREDPETEDHLREELRAVLVNPGITVDRRRRVRVI